MRPLVLSIVLTVNLAAQGTLEIIAAYWGVDGRFADVTARVRSTINNNALNFTANTTALASDPARGADKILRIYYRANGQFAQGEWRENQLVQVNIQNLPTANPAGGFGLPRSGQFGGFRRSLLGPPPLRIVSATYGAGNQQKDVTALVQSRVSGSRLDLQVTNENLGGDPALNVVKELIVSYQLENRTYQARASENGMLRLPDPALLSLRITRASYGAGNQRKDELTLLQRSMINDRLDMEVNNTTMEGDPALNSMKDLQVTYEWQGRAYEIRVPENSSLHLPDASNMPLSNANAGLRIVSAQYGAADTRVVDVTLLLTSRVVRNRLAIAATNDALGGDPAVNTVKELYVLYDYNGQRREARTAEGMQLSIP